MKKKFVAILKKIPWFHIEPAQEHNELVSRLYGGYAFGDDIVGPAIFFRQEGPNLCPLQPVDVAKLSLCLGVPLPANK